MKRLLPRILIFAALGIATTIAVAWVCALEVQLQDSTCTVVSCRWRARGSAVEGRLSAQRNARFGSARYACAVVMFQKGEQIPTQGLSTEQAVRDFVPRWSRHTLLDWVDREKESSTGEFIVQGVDARGWPFHALWCAYAWSPETEPDLWYWLPHGGGIQLGDGLMPTDPADWWPRAALPCLPIWGGLWADTVLYAGAWWVVLGVPGRVRGWVRRRRGMCAGCGYEQKGLGAGSACPECGVRLLVNGGVRVG